MTEWKKYKLEEAPIEIIDGDRGKNYPSQHEFYNNEYCLFLSTRNVRKNGFDFSECQFINKEKDDKLRKGKLKRFDTVLTTRGTIGNIGYYDENIPFDNIRINSGMIIIRPKLEKLNPKYCFYIFRKLNKEFESFVSGSAQPQLPIKDLNDIDIKIPNLPEQTAIAEVLSSLDDKIDLLHRQNKTLEQIAETLFRQWFVEEAEEGWKVGTLGDEFDFIMGQSPPGETLNENGDGIMFYQGRSDFGFRFPEPRIYTTAATRIANKFDTLVSVRAPVGDMNIAFEKCCLGRGVAAFQFRNNPTFYSYTYYKLRSLMELIKQFEDSGTVFGSIGKDNFKKLEIIIPHIDAVNKFQEEVSPLDEKIYINTKQIRTLTRLRDTLLPKLMSGEVRLKMN